MSKKNSLQVSVESKVQKTSVKIPRMLDELVDFFEDVKIGFEHKMKALGPLLDRLAKVESLDQDYMCMQDAVAAVFQFFLDNTERKEVVDWLDSINGPRSDKSGAKEFKSALCDGVVMDAFGSPFSTIDFDALENSISFIQNHFDPEVFDEVRGIIRMRGSAEALSRPNIGRIVKEERIKDKLPSILKYTDESFYRESFTDFDSLIKPSMPSSLGTGKTGVDKIDPEYVHIRNIEEFGTEKFKPEHSYVEGKKFFCLVKDNSGKDIEVPVGYNCFIPENKAKSVIVRVYGGTQSKKSQKSIEQSSKIDGGDKLLLSKSVAIIKLSLCNLKFQHSHQLKMENWLHDAIHESIDSFSQTLKCGPGTLHPSLAALKGLPLALAGTSFGGRTTIKHAALYPDSFDCYVSKNGPLSLSDIFSGSNKIALKSLGGDLGLLDFNKVMDPMQDIDKVTKPVLILQNANDHCVPANNASILYNKCIELGKQNVALIIMPEGKKGSIEDKVHLGHGLVRSVPIYDEIAEFIQHSDHYVKKEQVKARSEWFAHYYSKANLDSSAVANFNQKIFSKWLVEYNLDKQSLQEFCQTKMPEIYKLEQSIGNYALGHDVSPSFKDTSFTHKHMKKGLKLHLEQLMYYRNSFKLSSLDVEDVIDAKPELIKQYTKIMKSVLRYPHLTDEYDIYFFSSFVRANPDLIHDTEIPSAISNEFIDFARTDKALKLKYLHNVSTLENEGEEVVHLGSYDTSVIEGC